MAQSRGLALGLALSDGTSIRAHPKGRRGGQKDSDRAQRG
jgi:hypothetical protein